VIGRKHDNKVPHPHRRLALHYSQKRRSSPFSRFTLRFILQLQIYPRKVVRGIILLCKRDTRACPVEMKFEILQFAKCFAHSYLRDLRTIK
jgi:hypothetical protein